MATKSAQRWPGRLPTGGHELHPGISRSPVRDGLLLRFCKETEGVQDENCRGDHGDTGGLRPDPQLPWNLLDKMAKKHQAQARLQLRPIPYAETRQEAERLKAAYQRWCRRKGLEDAAVAIDHDWDRLVTFYDFPKEHWIHLRTSNVIESPFAALRLRTDAAKRFKKVENATAVIWKMLMVAEKRFRRLHAPELLTDVARGAVYINGLRVNQATARVAA